MKEEKDNLRDYMKNAFHDYEVVPDLEDWNRIEKTLRKRKRRPIILWTAWSSAASLLILIALYTGGILNNSAKAPQQIASQSAKQTQQSDTTSKHDNVPFNNALKTIAAKKQLSSNQPTGSVQQNHEKILSTKTIRNNNTTAFAKPKETISQSIIQVKRKSSVNKLQTVNATEENKLLLASGQNKPTLPVISPYQFKEAIASQSTDLEKGGTILNSSIHKITPQPIVLANNTKTSKYTKVLIPSSLESALLNEIPKDYLANNASSLRFNGLSFSNSSGLEMPTSSDKLNYTGSLASQLTSSMYLNSVKVFGITSTDALNIGDLFQTKTRDFMPPFTVGLNVSFSLPNKWSIETGFQYTNLQSKGEVTLGSTNDVQFVTFNKYKVDETLYYLGIPIIVNYTFYNKRKTSLYVSAGLSIEKGITAKYKAVSEDNIPGLQPIYSHNAIRGLQNSINTGIGISYRFIPHFEVFGQPSITYYFNSQGKNTTVYSLHPWLFNLRSGIRYSFK